MFANIVKTMKDTHKAAVKNVHTNYLSAHINVKICIISTEVLILRSHGQNMKHILNQVS